MGKSSKKRKKEEMLSRSDNSESSAHNITTDLNTTRSVLSEATRTIYGSPEGINHAEKLNEPNVTSTPLPDLPVSNIAAQITETHRKLDFIMQKLQKLDVIEEKFQKLDSKVNCLENKVQVIEEKNAEYERSVNFVSEKFDELKGKTDCITEISKALESQKKEMIELAANIDRRNSELEKLSGEMELMSEKKEDLSSKVLDLQCRSMKNNLVFSGLLGETRDEDTERKLREFIYDELEIDRHIEFGNVHRFGRFVRGKARPIVARFLYNSEREEVMANAYKLRGSQCSIREQFPKAIEDRRRQLYPIMRDYKRSGVQNVKMIRDKLYINGQLYDERNAPVRNVPTPTVAMRSIDAGADPGED
ncbi:hypothetical protein FSP39_019055 [Pinctada imbricata]|uniref:Uncharacterized protein n=1 Tax=Pinctada imbricata TaxID=66713 RepID=A0AA89BZI1_PINIB|nr:hypothetical protein FSP39_019055 [Pinctada imbricata]